MFINEQLISEIKRRNSLTNLVGVRPDGYTRCPVEGCPSRAKQEDKANIRPETWKCYVCGTQGDIFNWVMYEKGLTFGGALRHLAQLGGIQLSPNRERSAGIQAVVAAANRFLLSWTPHNQSYPENSHNPFEYLANERAISKQLIFRHQIGYIDREGLVLKASGLTEKQLLQLGFLDKRDNGSGTCWSRMAGRYIFPIRDLKGRLVQVKGRLDPKLSWDDQEPKSKSLPKSNPYQPTEWGTTSAPDYLYLEETLHEARRSKTLFICEGEPDTLTMRLLGYQAVGLQGSEGLYKHAHKLVGIQRIYLALDNDEATEMKLVREMTRLMTSLPGTEMYRIRLPHCAGRAPNGKPNKVDVNDYHVKFGAGRPEFEALRVAAVSAYEIVFKELALKYDDDNTELRRLFRSAPVAEKSRLVDVLARVTGYDPGMLAFGLDPRFARAHTG